MRIWIICAAIIPAGAPSLLNTVEIRQPVLAPRRAHRVLPRLRHANGAIILRLASAGSQTLLARVVHLNLRLWPGGRENVWSQFFMRLLGSNSNRVDDIGAVHQVLPCALIRSAVRRESIAHVLHQTHLVVRYRFRR